MNNQDTPKIERRGGRRPNSGRAKHNTVLLYVRISPELAERIREIAKAEHMTLGQVVERHLDL